MKKLVLALMCLSGLAGAQDNRDEDIFGEKAKPTTPEGVEDKESQEKKEESLSSTIAKGLADTLQIGGRLEIRSSTSQAENEPFQKGPLVPSKSADIYFDARPSDQLRVFLRTRISENDVVVPTEIPGDVERKTEVQNAIDELWFKWDVDRSVFFTFGKQHVKWGSGQIWNPTDFTAREVRDPFELFDRRLGQDLFKIHIPNEKLGFNYYAIVQLDDSNRNDDVGLALRGEFAFLGTSELAVTAQSRRNSPVRFGLDVSSALGPVDVNVEAAFTKRHNRTFYKDGSLEGDQIVLPTPYKDEDHVYNIVDVGISYALKYSDDDSIYFGAEYLYNELGYDDRFRELFALILTQSQSLYAGREYVSGYIRLPNPGTWNKSAFYLTDLSNLSDGTSSLRITGTYLLANYATFEAYVSRCFGDYGEFCFKVPEKLVEFGETPGLDPQLQGLLSSLPTEKTVLTAGIGLSINF